MSCYGLHHGPPGTDKVLLAAVLATTQDQTPGGTESCQISTFWPAALGVGGLFDCRQR